MQTNCGPQGQGTSVPNQSDESLTGGQGTGAQLVLTLWLPEMSARLAPPRAEEILAPFIIILV